MKRNILAIASIVLILSLLLGLGISSCTSTTTTTVTATVTNTATTTTTATKTVTFTKTETATATVTATKTVTATPTTTTTPGTTTTPATTTTPPAGPSVYVSVSVDSQLLVAAQPVDYTGENMTVDDVIKAAHVKYYADGLNGYQADESAFGPGYYIINICWGVKNIPCIIINDHPNSEVVFQAVNAVKVNANDNIIICTAKSGTTLTPVSLTATVSDGKVTITAKSWGMNPSNYQWSSKLDANANVLDSTGASLGKTDDKGQITIDIPTDGIVIIEGFAAINVNASATTG